MEALHPDIFVASLFLFNLQDITLIVALFISLLLLLVCSALISGSEVAFFSLTHNEIETFERDQKPSSQRILDLKDRPRTLLATILISNNFINIAIVILSDYLIRTIFSESTFDAWGEETLYFFEWEWISAHAVGTFYHFAITVIGVTFLLVLFGEVAPKIYAKFHNEHLSRMMSGPLKVLSRIFWPISYFLVHWSVRLEKRLLKRSSQHQAARKDDIDRAIELTVQREKSSQKEVDILKSIVKFSDVTVKQIMKSRLDVVAIDFNENFEDIFKMIRESGFSRIPVYNEDFDNITGILYVKDLLGHLEYVDSMEDFEWQQLIHTDVMYVPESKKINELLKEFQDKRLHMAIVVDEYGGSSGIVTLEDVMEEVIGEIKDEFDQEEELEYVKLDDRNYIFEGKTLLNDVCRIMGLDTTTFDDIKGDADSIAGLMLEVLGYLPKAEQEISYKQYRFRVMDVSSRRIEKVKISIDYNA